MESHPQNPEFRNNPENFHPCNWWNNPFHSIQYCFDASLIFQGVLARIRRLFTQRGKGV